MTEAKLKFLKVCKGLYRIRGTNLGVSRTDLGFKGAWESGYFDERGGFTLDCRHGVFKTRREAADVAWGAR